MSFKEKITHDGRRPHAARRTKIEHNSSYGISWSVCSRGVFYRLGKYNSAPFSLTNNADDSTGALRLLSPVRRIVFDIRLTFCITLEFYCHNRHPGP